MKCPFCGFEESKVTDSRSAMEMMAIKRRRECLKCEQRFTTFETIDLTLQVRKRDGTYQDFQEEKLIKGIEAACRYTRVSHDQVLGLAHKISSDLMASQIREITSRELGEIVMKHLQELDTVAYIRFACVYKRFTDIKDLLDALDSIKYKDENFLQKNTKLKEMSYASKKK
ncbi:MAG: transcriptional repressor NrdR [Chlamydiae bacterium]|nr:transcriptional repressor NrdR [Chlamydiota bacterium]